VYEATVSSSFYPPPPSLLVVLLMVNLLLWMFWACELCLAPLRSAVCFHCLFCPLTPPPPRHRIFTYQARVHEKAESSPSRLAELSLFVEGIQWPRGCCPSRQHDTSIAGLTKGISTGVRRKGAGGGRLEGRICT
jgi:hypothetical protein